MLGYLYTLVDGRPECKPAGGGPGAPIKDVMHYSRPGREDVPGMAGCAPSARPMRPIFPVLVAVTLPEAGSSVRMAARTMVQSIELVLTSASCAVWSAWMLRRSVLNSTRASNGTCLQLSATPAADRMTRRSTACLVMPSTIVLVPVVRVIRVAQAVAAQRDDHRVVASDRSSVRDIALSDTKAGGPLELVRRAREGRDVVTPTQRILPDMLSGLTGCPEDDQFQPAMLLLLAWTIAEVR